MLVSCLYCFSTLNVEAMWSSETSVDFYRVTWRYNPEDMRNSSYYTVVRTHLLPIWNKNSALHINSLFLSLCLYSPSDLGRFFSFLILYTTGRTPWAGDQPTARPPPTHRTT
jgi:hypothetical protein